MNAGQSEFVRLMQAIGDGPDERVPVCLRLPGQPGLTVTRGAAKDAPARAGVTLAQPPLADVWFQVCTLDPTKEAALSPGQRGTAADIARVPALWADLDVKPGGLESLEQCLEVVAAVSSRLGNRQPVALVFTGHGLHAYWLLIGGEDVARASGLVRRFGRLVQAEAARLGGHADSVYDLARVLRVPGTYNCKDPANPLPVTAEFAVDTDPDVEPDSIDLDALEDALLSAGIPEEPEPTGATGPRVEFGTWTPAAETCSYVRAMVAHWPQDNPDARHPRMLSHAFRLMAALRIGCISGPDFVAAIHVLEDAFAAWCARAGDARAVKPLEVAAALEYAREATETRSEESLWAELGHHVHAGGEVPGSAPERPMDRDADGLWDRSPELALLRMFALSLMAAPEAVLFVVLLRVLQTVPPHVRTPALIGGPGSLNSLLALVGPSGAGKGSAERAAEAAVVLPAEVHTAALGSGEGIAHQYKRRAKGGELETIREAVLLTAAEVQGLGALSSRNGSTVDDQLRKAFMGEELSFAYADATRRLPMDAHTYRFGLTVGVQPEHAGILLDQAAGGTPQRFAWAKVTDPAISENPPAMPKPLVLEPLDWSLDPAVPRSWREFPLCPEAVSTIRSAHVARQQGNGDALDGHALFVRVKMACAVAVLHGRQEVTSWDWETSGLLMARSDRTRAEVRQVLGAMAAKRSREMAEVRGRESLTVEEMKHANAVKGAQLAVRRAVAKGGGSTTRKAAKDAAGPRYRDYLDEALAEMEANGELRQEGGRWVLQAA